MAKKNLFPGTVSKPALKPGALFGASKSASASTSASSGKPPRASDIKPLSFIAHTVAQGIDFGRPSTVAGQTAPSSGSEWGSLLSNLTGGGLLGIGGAIGAIEGLFGGGKAAPPPLVEFRLPGSIDDTLSVSSSGRGVSMVNAVSQAPVAPQPLSGVTSPQSIGSIAVQAVAKSLLSSGPLGDIIGEL